MPQDTRHPLSYRLLLFDAAALALRDAIPGQVEPIFQAYGIPALPPLRVPTHEVTSPRWIGLAYVAESGVALAFVGPQPTPLVLHNVCRAVRGLSLADAVLIGEKATDYDAAIQAEIPFLWAEDFFSTQES